MGNRAITQRWATRMLRVDDGFCRQRGHVTSHYLLQRFLHIFCSRFLIPFGQAVAGLLPRKRMRMGGRSLRMLRIGVERVLCFAGSERVCDFSALGAESGETMTVHCSTLLIFSHGHCSHYSCAVSALSS